VSLEQRDIVVLIDPPSDRYGNDRLFEDDPILNRDDCLSPFRLLKAALTSRGIRVHTADLLFGSHVDFSHAFYWSFGRLRDFDRLAKRRDVSLVAFRVTEPPVVSPAMYRALPRILDQFQKVYVYNIQGHGYERWHAPDDKLRPMRFTQARDSLREDLWDEPREKLIVMINGNKGGHDRRRELYSERIRALVSLHRSGPIDLYGPGWDMSLPSDGLQLAILYRYGHAPPLLYWRHRGEILSVYKGVARSKLETLARYKFALCYENMAMPGYVTEKLFDCFFAGTIPVYLGAPDVREYVPDDTFIDMRRFIAYRDLYDFLLRMPDSRTEGYRNAARQFLSSDRFHPFSRQKLVDEVEEDLSKAMAPTGLGYRSTQREKGKLGGGL